MSNFELNDDDVISIDSSSAFGVGSTLRVKDLLGKLRELCLLGRSHNEPQTYWFREKGVEGEILSQQGGGWQKGRLLFRLEFIPENSPIPKPGEGFSTNSPLDDLRSNLDI